MANYEDILFGGDSTPAPRRKQRSRAVEQDDVGDFILNYRQPEAPAVRPVAPPAPTRPVAIQSPQAVFGDERDAFAGDVDSTPRVSLPGSVFNNMPNPARARAIQDVGAPLSIEGQRRIQDAYKKATPAQRAVMSSKSDFIGGASRALDRKYEEAGPAASYLGDRREDREQQFVRQGSDSSSAEALSAMGKSVLDVGSIEETPFDFERAQFYRENPNAASASRIATGVADAYGSALDGFGLAVKDAIGLDTSTDRDRLFRERTREMQESAEVGVANDSRKNFEGAITSIATQLPWMAAGVATGGASVPLAAMVAQSWGESYKEGFQAGLSPAQNAIRASLFAAFEGLGEGVGLGKLFKIDGKPLRDVPTEKLADAMAIYVAKQVPGEVATTTGQFITDKLPSLGLNQDATFKDYLTQVADTILTSVIQGGVMYGGGRGALALRDRLQTDAGTVSRAIEDGVGESRFSPNSVDDFVRRSMRADAVDPNAVDPSQRNWSADQARLNESEQGTATDEAGRGATVVESEQSTAAANEPNEEILAPTTTSFEQQTTSVRNALDDDEELLRRGGEQEKVYDEEGNEVSTTAVEQQNETADPLTAVNTAVDGTSDEASDRVVALPIGDPTIWEPSADLPEPNAYAGVEPTLGRADRQKYLAGLAASPLFINEGLGDIKLVDPDEIGQSKYDSLQQVVRTYKKLFNVDIVLADFGDAKHHGYFDQKTGRVVLNARSADLTQAISHEAFHAFEKKHPELFSPIYETAVQLANPASMQTMFSAYGLMNDKEGARTSLGEAVDALIADPTDQAARGNLASMLTDPKNALARSELLAHMVGQASTPAMYAELVRRSGSASKANKAIQTLTDFLNGLYQKLFGRTVDYISGPDGIRQIQGMMNDIHNEVQRRTAVARSDAKAARQAKSAPAVTPVDQKTTVQKLNNSNAEGGAPAPNTAVNQPTTAVEQTNPAAGGVSTEPTSVSPTAGQAKVQGLKAKTRQAKVPSVNTKNQSASEFSDLEKSLQSKTRDTEQDGDVGVVVPSGKVRYVSMADAVETARAAIASGTKAVPYQIHRATGIRLGDTDRVIKAVQERALKDMQSGDATVAAENTETPQAANEAKPAKKGAMTRKQAEDKFDDLGIDPETKKSQVMSLAKKMVASGLMPADEMGNLEQINRDRDMGPEDLLGEMEQYVREPVNEESGAKFSRQVIGGFDTETAANGSMKVTGDVAEIRAKLPDGVVGRPIAGGLTFTTSDAPRVRAALGGQKLGYGRQGEVLEDLPMRDGKYVGAPEKYNTPDKLPALRKLLRKLAKEGAPGRYWYENSSRAVLRFTGENVQEARKFVALLAIYSPQAKVDANSTFALRAWAQYKAGKPIKVKTGVQDKKAQEAMDDVDKFWSGEKTGNFYLNLLRMIDPSTANKQGATIDMWMMRAGQYATDAPTDTQYSFMENETNMIAAELGWEPQQVQAAIWVAMKARMEDKGVKEQTEATSEENGWIRFEDKVSKTGKKSKVRVIVNEQEHRDNWLRYAFEHKVTPSNTDQAKFDFEDGVRRHIGQVSFEARPGRTTNVLPGIHTAPYAQQTEFQLAVQRAFYDENGNDLLAVRLGLLVESNDILAPGVWQGEVSPSNQKLVAVAPNKGDAESNTIDPAQKQVLNVYAAVAGLVARQEGVGYHKPFFSATKRDSNALDIDIGRPINPAEAIDLERAISDWMQANDVQNWQNKFAIISSAKGVRLVNFGAVENAVLQTKVMAAAAEALPDHSFRLFASDGDMIGNNWEENPDGQEYIQRIRAEGRSDVLEWVRDFLAPRVQDVFDEYSEKYGWGNPGRVPDGLRSGRAADEGNGNFSRAVQYEAQVEGDAPVFSDRPIQPEAVSLVGYHYSGAKRYDLNGKSYGSATSRNKGQEYERVMAAKDRRLRNRVYFYTAPMAEIPRSEPVVIGSEVHKANLLNIYDSRSDDSRVPSGGDLNSLESAVIDAGYDGYIAHGFGMVVLLDTKPVEVQHLGTKQSLAASIRPNPVLSGETKINFPVRSYLARDGKLTKRATEFLTFQQNEYVKNAVPSFGMEYGEYKVAPEDKDRANAALEEAGSDFRFSRQIGVNVRNDGDNRYADLIVDGEKTMESRDSDSLRPYVGKTVGIVRTGEGRAKLIGSVTIGEPRQVNEQEFRRLATEHLVPEGSAFDIKPGSKKFLYPLTNAKRFDDERDVESQGIVARSVSFSRQIESPEFKRWFGDSKIVNEDGTPRVMYHGTARDITEFRPKQANAIYVTPKPGFAESFSYASSEWMMDHLDQFLTPEQIEKSRNDAIASIKRRVKNPKQRDLEIQEVRYSKDFRDLVRRFFPSGENVLPLFVKAEKPFDYENPAHLDEIAKTFKALLSARDEGGSLPRGAISDGLWTIIESRDIQQSIRDAGFDAFYIKEGGVKNLAVYQPTQLKSAIGNNGEFDPANPDIRFSKFVQMAHATIEDINTKTPLVIGKSAQAKEDLTFAHRIKVFRDLSDRLGEITNVPIPSMIASNAMRVAGMPHQAVTWSVAILDKVLFTKHSTEFDGVTAAEINRAMRDPVAIIQSDRANDEYDIVTDIVRTNEEGRPGPVVIIVKTNATFEVQAKPGLFPRPALRPLRITAVKSAYVRSYSSVGARFSDVGRIKYLEQNRARDIFKETAVRYPAEAISKRLSQRYIPNWFDVVGEVGQRFDGIVEDMPMFSRALTPEERAVESELWSDLRDNYEAKKSEYWAASPDTLDVDVARDLSLKYKSAPSRWSAAVHEPASDFIKRLYGEKLASMPKGSIVLFSAGGGGSGKGYILGGFAADISRAADLVYDTTMSGFESGQRRIQAAIDAGHKASVVLVYRDPVAALSGAIGRAAKTGRVVPINVMAKDHAAGRDAVKRLVEYYAGNPSFSAVAVDNNGTTPRYVSIDQVEQIDENEVLEDLYDELDKQAQNPDLAGVVAAFRAASPVRPADQQRVGRGRRREVVGREDAGVRREEGQASGRDARENQEGLLSRKVLTQGDRFTLPERTIRERISNKLANEVSRVEDVQQDIVRQGGTLNDKSNVQFAQTRMYRKSAQEVERFREEKVYPLMRRIAKSGIKLDDLALYLYANHAQKRNAYIASINPQFPDGGSGMFDSEAKQQLTAFRARPDYQTFKALAKELQAITVDTAQVLVNGGLVDQNQVSAWQNTYGGTYVPLKGWEDIDESMKVSHRSDPRVPFAKRALGRGSRAGQIIENILGDYERAVIAVQRNNVRKAFYRFVIDNPDQQLWQPQRIILTKRFNKGAVLSPLAMAQGNVTYSATVDDREGHTVAVRIGGQLKSIWVKDEAMLDDLATAIDAVDGDTQAALRVWRGINRTLAKSYTALSPAFVLTNATRDLQTALLTTGIEKKGGLWRAAKITAQLIPLSWNIWRATRNNEWTAVGNRYRDAFIAMRDAGGAQGFMGMQDLQDRQRDLNQIIEETQNSIRLNPRTWYVASRKMVRAAHDFIMDLNGAIENAARVAAYAEAIKAGETAESAAQTSANVTVDFARRGKWTPLMSSLWLFANPAIQGTRQVAKLAFSKKGAAFTGALVTLGYMVAMMAAGATGDDDEPYWDKPDAQDTKLKALLFFDAEGNQYKIPMAYGWGFFVNVGYAIADIQRGKSIGSAASFLTNSVFQHFSPLGTADNMASFFGPTLLDPVIAIATNKTERGRPLMPDSPEDRASPDSDRYFSSSRGTYTQRATEWLNEFTGGSSAVPGAISVSPETVNYVRNFVLGGAGSFVADAASSIYLTATLGGATAVEKNKVPILKNFYRTKDIRGEQAAFFENSREATQALNEAKAYWGKPDNSTAVQERLDQNNGLASLAQSLSSYNKALSALRKEDISYVDNKDMSEVDKEAARRGVDERRKQLYDEFNRAFYAQKKLIDEQ
jgi:hypothetical protein